MLPGLSGFTGLWATKLPVVSISGGLGAALLSGRFVGLSGRVSGINGLLSVGLPGMSGAACWGSHHGVLVVHWRLPPT